MNYANRVNRTISKGSTAWRVHGLAKQMLAQGEDVILLTIGDPDFDTPQPIIDHAVKSLNSGRTHYTPLLGEEPLREAIASFHTELTGQSVTSENVIVTVGAQCGLYVAAMCTLEPGDEVIVFDPTYSTYGYLLGASGAKMIYVSLKPDRHFQVDPNDVAAAITGQTKALFLNTPHNPTGAMIHTEEMKQLVELCKQHDLWMITDEVYGTFAFEQPHISPASFPDMAERTIVISSLSKSHAMTGWRLGWAVGPTEAIRHMGNLSAGMLFGLPPFIQDAGVHALTKCMTDVDAMRTHYKARRDLVYELLQDAPKVSCHLPEGGLYMMIDVRETEMNALTFAEELLANEKVALLPGEAFGPGGAGHVRLSLVSPEDVLIEACERTVRFAQKV